MSGGKRTILSGLVFVMTAIALALALIRPACVPLPPPWVLIVFLSVAVRPFGPGGYLSVVRSVCKIE